MKDGRFFYAAENGDVTAYDKAGKKIWQKHITLKEGSNSNYLLNQNEELMVNTLSSPSNSTVFHTISIDGKETTSPVISNLSTCFIYNYPLGGYITEGFTEDYKWNITRLKEDLSIEWIYSMEDGENNLYIADISEDGRILFHGNYSDTNIHYLRELDSFGKRINHVDFDKQQLAAAYFKDKIIVSAEKLRVLETDFTISAEFDGSPYPQIATCDDTFFVYNPGSYQSGNAVIYDGYCMQYNNDNTMTMNKTFTESDRFLRVGNNGKLYYKK